MYKSRKTGVIGIIITIILLIIIVVLSNGNNNNVSFIESSFNKLVMPLQNGLVFLKNKIEGNNTFFSDITNLKNENKELKERNSELEQAVRELDIIKAENTKLKDNMNLMEKYAEYTTILADVIGKDFSNYSKTIVINVGKNDGIEKNMTVISDKGLVGHIISVDTNTSKVQTIIDISSTVSATISTTRDGIICSGVIDSNNKLKATYIPIEANVIQGDKVETSGMGGIYRKGIQIGTIDAVVNTKNITDRYATIKTSVDFSKIETVLVIK